MSGANNSSRRNQVNPLGGGGAPTSPPSGKITGGPNSDDAGSSGPSSASSKKKSGDSSSSSSRVSEKSNKSNQPTPSASAAAALSTLTEDTTADDAEEEPDFSQTDQPAASSGEAAGQGQRKNKSSASKKDAHLAEMMVELLRHQMQHQASVDERMIMQEENRQRIDEQRLQQNELQSNRQLARTSAGQKPVFYGRSNDLEAHSFINEMERWFDTALITSDHEKMEAVQSSFKDSALVWWTNERHQNRLANYNTWAKFCAAIRAKYMPIAPEDLARSKIRELAAGKNADVPKFISNYLQWNQLILDRSERDRVVEFRDGLPDEYRQKCVEKNYSSLEVAVEEISKLYNARSQSKGAAKLAVAEVNHVDMESIASQSDGASAASTSSSSSTGHQPGIFPPSNGQPQQISSLQEQLAQLTKMLVQQQQFNPAGNGYGGQPNTRGGFSNNSYNNYNGGGRGRWRGRGGGRGGGWSGSRQRSGSPRLSDLGVTEDAIKQRKINNLCLRCGEPGHMIRECTGAVKKN